MSSVIENMSMLTNNTINMYETMSPSNIASSISTPDVPTITQWNSANKVLKHEVSWMESTHLLEMVERPMEM